MRNTGLKTSAVDFMRSLKGSKFCMFNIKSKVSFSTRAFQHSSHLYQSLELHEWEPSNSPQMYDVVGVLCGNSQDVVSFLGERILRVISLKKENERPSRHTLPSVD